ncbi:aquaporin Z [Chroogloeocystis siderophila]|jgi:aquaporin Z|uniref:Aquaporin Z n=1 Tax=Chroogloeocystis siderophila 5.2 s.c.1 TaxID=247279 RepID=A0A1U7I0C1_9CHRO|nr:aquaporin Z [Chroogloeocystis siderophila]OKH29321.1 aquaporin Z [Chroogloeocystis siderophila 5.2 s.c.1]
MNLTKRCVAEFIGTFWLVLGGCGSAVLAAAYTTDSSTIGVNTSFPLGIGFVGVSLAFGLTVLTMAYAIGHISGCHLNPAVSFGLWAGKRFPGSELLPYIIAQVLGAIVGAGVVYLIASGNSNFTLAGSNPLATNGYGVHSPGGYNLPAAFITEVVMTFMFLMIILGATDNRAPKALAPIAIGFGLTLIHLISIPVTNTSVNPARSLGPAIFAGRALFGQVWLFWLAPIVGALLAGWLYLTIFSESVVEEPPRVREPV